MSATKWGLIVGVAAALGLASACQKAPPRWPSGLPEASPEKAGAKAGAPPSLVGTASCSAGACHGGVEPRPEPGARRDEHSRWARTDRHATAYATLFSEKSAQIARRLRAPGAVGLPPPEDLRCLACHAMPSLGARKDLAWMRADGVGCESCHGAARDWLGPHTAPDRWAKLTAAEKQRHGMTPVESLGALARACVGCHVGAPPDSEGGAPARDVNHELIAAGHPRLNFELTAYLANLPPHWRPTAPKRGPRPAQGADTWMTGQVVSAEAALELLAYRAEVVRDEHWPELAEYDCFSCHRNLQSAGWRQGRDFPKRSPGRWSWGSWYFSMLPVLPGGRPEDLGDLKKLRESMERPSPNGKVVRKRAKASAQALRKWEARLTGPQPVRALRARLGREGQSLGPPSWDLAAQLTLAVGALAEGQRDREAVRKLLRRLAFPPGMEGPEAFRWDKELDGQLEEALRRQADEGR